jgi:salicylate hydroxylase
VLADEVAAPPDDVVGALQRYCAARYLRTGRVQLSARLYGEVYRTSGVTRELRNAFVRSKSLESHLDGMAWLYHGISTRSTSREATV